MNETISKFLAKHGYKKEELESLNECTVKDQYDINPIISRNRVYKSYQKPSTISIADILGYDYSYAGLNGDSLIDNLDYYFDENGSSYKTRAISMLDYSSKELLPQLSGSFKRQPVTLVDADKGKYIIESNGLHRFHIIRTHFLSELASLGENARQQLKEKYTFEVNVSETDFFKTYSNYILKYISKNDESLSSQLDENYQYTGNCLLKNSLTETTKVLTDSQLSSYLKKAVVDYLTDKKTSKKEFKMFISAIEDAYKKYESFREFYEQNLSEIIPSSYIKKNRENYFEEDIVCE